MGTRRGLVLVWIGVALAASWGSLSAQTPAPAGVTAVTSSPARVQAADAPVLLPASEKKHALELEADKLVAMATELKARVDKTNKNILSLTVVEQAEEIERYAHQLKTGEKK